MDEVFAAQVGRSKVRDALTRRIGKPGQDVGEVIARWDFEPAAAFDNGEDGGDLRPGFFAAQMQPVLAIMRRFA
jgi:hypothetical protein